MDIFPAVESLFFMPIFFVEAFLFIYLLLLLLYLFMYLFIIYLFIHFEAPNNSLSNIFFV